MRRSSHVLMLLALLAGATEAQIVRGQVVDSLTGIPVPAAMVTLLNASDTPVAETKADEEGLFLVRVPEAGEYHLRISRNEYRISTFPPFTLGADEVKAFMLLVAPQERPALRGDDVIAELCPEGTVDRGEGVLAGFVYDEDLSPVVDAYVAGSWPALTGAFAELAGAVDAGRLRNAWFTDSAGTYAVCGIPPETEVMFYAGADSLLSDFHTLRFGDGGAYVDGMYHAAEQLLMRHDFRLLAPDGRSAAVGGIVVDSAMQPIVGAVVELAEADLQTATDTNGAFNLGGLPGGMIQVTVRQAGFRPVSREIQLLHGDTVELTPNPLVLEPLPTELNPVVVAGERPSARRPLADFWQRRESTSGRFITREEFEKEGNSVETTDVLRKMGGVLITPALQMDFPDSPWYWVIIQRTRGPRSFTRRDTPCFPLYFVDRRYLGTSAEVDINRVVPLLEVEAVEVYSGLTVPREFMRKGYECGIIVFWTR